MMNVQFFGCWQGAWMRRGLLYLAGMSASALLVACGGGGDSSSASVDAVQTSAVGAAQSDPAASFATTSAALSVACSGTNCGASSATQYSGSGIGVWRYDNTSASSASLNVNISGVSAGKKVTLVFSNGNSAAASGLPGSGAAATISALVSTVALTQVSGAGNVEAQAHAKIEQMNEHIAQLLNKRVPVSERTSTIMAQKTVQAVSATPPAVGSSRVWYDNGDDYNNPVPYTVQVAATCSLPTGRNVVIWVDPSAFTDNLLVTSDLTDMTNAVCGSNGGFVRLNALLGDVWGPISSSLTPYMIQDGASLQDINIVFVNKTSGTTWCGYFSSLNNLTQSYASSVNSAYRSNEALAFFMDSGCYHMGSQYARSSLLHEAAHMTNYYQRSVLRGTSHETWLEETSAMLTEDVVSPAVLNGYSPTLSQRIDGYLRTGAGVSYVNWVYIGQPSYSLGGSFGAFLNRRYGLKIYQQLMTNCSDDSSTAGSSYTCMDSLIKANGGVGFADEYARFGASVFSLMNGTKTVGGYGYPAKTDGSYTLSALNLSSLRADMPSTAASLGSTFPATSHTYQVSTIATGGTVYKRSGVVVPANTSLMVVVQ